MQHAAQGEEQEPSAIWFGNGCEAGRPWQAQMAVGNKSVTRSQCRDGSLAAKETGGDEYGRARAPLLGRSVVKMHACPEPLGPRRQQLCPPVSGRDMGLPTGTYPEPAETAPRKKWQPVYVILQDVEAFAKARDVQARSGDSPPQLPFPVRGRCAGILSSLLSCGEGTGVVPESASRPEKKAKHCLHREMVVCIQCHPRPCSLLQCCNCVCFDRLGRVNPGREYGARESKSQEAPAFPQLIFPDGNEALLRKQR